MTESISRRTALTGVTGIAVAAAAGALLVPGVARATTIRKYPFPASSPLTVLVTGDAGTGTAAQLAVTKAARRLFAAERLSLVLGLGDNIYENGPETPDDDEFADKFEAPNTGLDVPWLMALGNHDNSLLIPGDGSWLARGNNEVGYHERSPRWWMPSRYYSVALPERNPVAEFFVLDLNPLCAYLPQLFYWAPDGPYMRQQREWLRQRLAASKAPWKFVCNHFPYVNNGKHGDAGSYDGVPSFLPHANGAYVKELFDDYVLGRAQFTLSGHDHSLQVLRPTTATKGTIPLVSGAAGKTSSHGGGDNPAYFEQFDTLGIMVLDIAQTSVGVRVYTIDPATAVATLAHQRTLA
ncbi:MAG: metallophosphoesterase [Thermocrispum sp.]